MIQIAIVEDDSADLSTLTAHLSQYEIDRKLPLSVRTYSSGEDLLCTDFSACDLLFLDIELGGINGIETARAIRETNRDLIIVLITNLMQYAIQGYSVQASDYILKPVSYADFQKKMDAFAGMIDRKQTALTLKVGHDYRRFNIGSITYLEVYGHQLVIHTRDRAEQVSGTLARMEEELHPYGFVKCNKCYLVNLDYVDGIVGDEVEVAGEFLKISRREKKQFIQALTRYAKG